jgi:serine/threonine protein kinase
VGQRTVLAGRYTLVSPLGRGGMGQVWEGRDERLGRTVAVKLLTGYPVAGRAQQQDPARRFTREAVVTAGLAHPGVPAIYDAGEYDGGLFLVMELVDGATISDLVAEQGPLPVPWAAGIAAQVAAVLVLAHERGIIHRDIKPENVMVTPDGTAKVLDFGVAAILDQRITSTGAAIGTPAYMAPEQLHGLSATPRTDLYTLGCLLYEMLSGEPVFSATSAAELMHKHLAAAPAPLRRADLDPWLVRLVWQLLEKDPARRPADARETYDRLLPYVQRPGPLGDINPAAGSRSSMQLYAQILARLRGTDPGMPWPPGPPPFAPPPFAQSPLAPPPLAPVPATKPGFGWTLAHSLWILPTLAFGLFTWVSFGYIGTRHGRLSWLAVGGAYLAAEITSVALLVSSPDTGTSPGDVIGFLILLALWPAGIIHALWVNRTTRLPLVTRKNP